MTAPAPAPVLKRPAYLLIPLGAGALVALGLGVYGRVHQPTFASLIGDLGFGAKVIEIKFWLTVVALGLAAVQLLTALWMYGKLGVRAPSWTGTLHRSTGTIAFLVTVPVAYQCLWAAGFQDSSPRVLAHSLLGCVFYGAFVAKVLTLRIKRVPGWALPWVAGLLFAALVGVGVTGAVGYFELQPSSASTSDTPNTPDSPSGGGGY